MTLSSDLGAGILAAEVIHHPKTDCGFPGGSAASSDVPIQAGNPACPRGSPACTQHPLPQQYQLLAQGSPAPSPLPSILQPHLSSLPGTLISFPFSSPPALHPHLPSIPNPPSVPREEQPDPQSCSPSPMSSIYHQLQSQRLGVIFPSALSRVF